MALVRKVDIPRPKLPPRKNGMSQARISPSLDSDSILIDVSSLLDITEKTNSYKIMGKWISPLTPMTPKSEEKLENRFSLPSDLFEAVDFSDMGVVNEPTDCLPRFIIGEKYALSGATCEGFEMEEKVYKLVAIHDEYEGVDINSLIVKQVDGPQDKIFTLSKNDCDHIGIEYENGLQLFPKYLNWRHVKDRVPFNPSNLGTTPLSDIDNTIRFILFKINGFKDYHDGFILTPNGRLIKEKRFEDSIKVISNEPIVYDNVTSIPENTLLHTCIVRPSCFLFNHGNFISSDDSIYLLIDLTIKNEVSIDGFIGVAKEFFDGFNPNEHFTISWDELGACTVEEYEAEKERKEKAIKERIAREEAERKSRIEEEEKRIQEEQRRKEELVSMMKNAIEMPTIPKMVDFDIKDLSGISLYADGLDIYFKSLDTSLTKLSNDLTKMSRNMGINLDRRIKDNINNSLLNMFNF